MVFKKNSSNSVPFNRLSGAKLQNLDNKYPRYIHFEILNFNNLFESSISKYLPFGFKFAYQITSRLSKCLGVMTIFLPDNTNNNSFIKMDNNDNFSITYKDSNNKLKLQSNLIRNLKFDILRNMCIPLKTILFKNGSGIHYAGCLPMSKKYHGVNLNYKSNLFKNLYIADASTFPSLPSKSITFNIMYNAYRFVKNLKIEKK